MKEPGTDHWVSRATKLDARAATMEFRHRGWSAAPITRGEKTRRSERNSALLHCVPSIGDHDFTLFSANSGSLRLSMGQRVRSAFQVRATSVPIDDPAAGGRPTPITLGRKPRAGPPTIDTPERSEGVSSGQKRARGCRGTKSPTLSCRPCLIAGNLRHQ